MNFGGSEGHRAADVFDLEPGAIEIARPFKFGEDAGRALFHDLRNELMRIAQFAAYGDKQTSLFRLTRIVRHIGHGAAAVADKIRSYCFRNFVDCHRLLWCYCCYGVGLGYEMRISGAVPSALPPQC